ncbi:MAG: carboxy terminal-processing peptidase [Pseudomonadales bacterium]|nr:carboxy terminal-processing peptidase [Pseudomonadales bacterium]MCP5183125.1 carboxy terminal-processing peptidase [Pseudomonadales bacterium]
MIASSVATSSLPVPHDLAPLSVHRSTSRYIVEQLRNGHYLRKEFDDSLSSQAFDHYLEALDNQRMYFLQSDIDALEKYRYTLDDAIRREDVDPAYAIFNIFQQRMGERLNFLIGEIDNHLLTYDFTRDETIELDRKDAAWPRDQRDQDDLWRKRLKSAALAMRLNDKPMTEIRELLSKRYRNRLKQMDQTKSEDVFQTYVNAFASAFDPHTQYFSPRTSQNFNINMSLSLEGIGAVLQTEDDYTSVVRLVPAGPADKAGSLKPAERIVSVGQGESGPLIDVVGWRLDDVVELIRGPKGSTVRLEVLPKDGEAAPARVINIVRNTVKLEEQAAQKKLLSLKQGDQTYRVGVIEIPTFYADFKAQGEGDPNYKSTTRDVAALIEELKADGIDGLVIDLRNNGGGSLQEADSLTGLFIESGPTVQVKSSRRNASVYADTDASIAWSGPMAVLVNRLSASASEIFAGAIQDYGRGLIVGSQTFGKGTVQTLVPLQRGQLKLTAAKFYRISGQSTQHQGVLPDVALPELYDTKVIGESSLEDALPWDMIQPALYRRYGDLHDVLPSLRTLHERRVADDPDFEYLRDLMARADANNQRKVISLNEVTRRKEQADDDQWRLDLENRLRKEKGEPLLASLDELDEEPADEEGSTTETTHERPPEDDALLRETGNVLMDYVNLTRQVAHVEGLPAEPATSRLGAHEG